MARKAGIWFLVVLALAATIAALALPPLAQPSEYHQFADQRTLLGIPNFFNVSSNVAFLLVGAAGVAVLLRNRSQHASRPLLNTPGHWPYLVLFVAVALTASARLIIILRQTTRG